MMVASTLGTEDFAALIAPYIASGEKVAVAVSGGPDSMALAFCLQRYVGQAGATNLTALIVEHGLRPESAQEAQTVAERLSVMGIEAHILPWHHDGIDNRVHVRARAARYRLLLDACKARGIAKLFLAHHADDQAETILMRFAKGSGIDGLAGMEAVKEVEGVQLIRPFLSLPKVRLIATCEVQAIPFITDPSNEADKYARGRLRRMMPLLEQEGFTRERLLDLSERAHEAKDALDFYAQAFLRDHAEILTGGAVRIDLSALRGQPRAVTLRAVAWILSDIDRTADYGPERKQLVPFVDWLLQEGESEARTLHGCLVQKGELCARAVFLREAAAIADRQPLEAGQTILWDGRWDIAYSGTETGLEVMPLGRQTHETVDGLAPRLRDLVPQGRIRAALPALWCGDQLAAIPVLEKAAQGPLTALCRPPRWV